MYSYDSIIETFSLLKNNKVGNLSRFIFSLFITFFENSAICFSQFQPTNNLQILDVNSSFESSQRDLPGNEIKSKIERMELNQKLTFRRKRSKNVASPLRDDLPVHRITLRAQNRHPALRVTAIDNLFKMIRFQR